ncbi:MAG TPA: two-component regulator propeller domain-containing protein, partial [Flavisolibacter sp.]|nr:two-component regulator propeller domain-containing protein [Flavisolibacter sp.]
MKTKTSYSVVFCLVLMLSVKAFSQKPDIRFEHLSTEEGFSQNLVTCILKDHYGFMWFGTDDGLNRYDGYKITLYRNNPKNPKSLSGNLINGIFEDSKGNIWIAIDGGGVNIYDRNTNSFARLLHNDNIPSSLRDNAVKCFYEDVNGNVWIGTYRGLDMAIGTTGRFKHYTIDPLKKDPLSEQITSVICDRQNNLWVGTMKGLALFNASSQTFRLFYHDEKNNNSISDDRVNVLMGDQNGDVWIGTRNGLNLLKKNSDKFIHFFNDKKNSNSLAHNYIWSLAKLEDGKIWIGTEHGLDLFDESSQYFFHYTSIPGDETSLPHNSLRCTYVDDQGILWLGSVAGGVRKYDKKLSRFGLYKPLNSNPATLNLKMVFSFAESKTGDIWIGTDGGGLNIFHVKDKTFSHFEYKKNDPAHSLLSNTVIKLLNSHDGQGLWIGTYGSGLSYYNFSTKTFTHYTPGDDNRHLSDKAVYALLEDRNGNLWIGTNDGGVNMLDKKSGILTKFVFGSAEDGEHLANSCIRSFYETTDGKIWIGTYGAGINIYDPITKKFTYLNTITASLSNNIVLSLHGDKHGNIWAGTMGGLNLWDEKKHAFVSFTEENGLANNVVTSIQEDSNGFLWLSTKKGITRFNPTSKKFKNYGLYNGLQGYEFLLNSGLKTSSGEMYFGGINGFNIFDPANMPENHIPPSVVITDFQLYNKSISAGENSTLKKDIAVTDTIILPFGKSMMSFEFAALNYTASEKNQYAYKLEGFDKDWIYSGTSRTATYTNLDPGEYTLTIKASNNDGVWNEKGKAIKVIITPPFWNTWWFRLLASFALVAVIYLVYRIRTKAIHQQKEQLELQVQERTQSLAAMTLEERKARQEASEANKELERKNKELEQFAYVASHDMQEPLRTISSFVNLLNSQYKDKFDDRAQKYMSFIVQATDRMKVLIHDLLEYSRIGKKKETAHLDLNKIVNEVLADLNFAIADSGATVEVEQLPAVSVYPTEMKQLFQNLIINAIKFRKKGTTPEIEISAEKHNGHWKFLVKDNGIGIDPKQAERIFVIFQRLHTRNEYEGSGIGLSHCKKIAELHKGKIWVESTPGEGSSFYFTI